MPTEPESQPHAPLSAPAFAILLALRDGEKHGYAILREVNQDHQGMVKLLPGTLYNLMRRMLADGWIQELEERPDPAIDDERRRYYRLTGLGNQVLAREARRLDGLVRSARQHGLLGDEGEQA